MQNATLETADVSIGSTVAYAPNAKAALYALHTT